MGTFPPEPTWLAPPVPSVCTLHQDQLALSEKDVTATGAAACIRLRLPSEICLPGPFGDYSKCLLSGCPLLVASEANTATRLNKIIILGTGI